MVVEAIHYNAAVLEHNRLQAFVVMSNHVYLLIDPNVALPKLTKSLKGERDTGTNGQPFSAGGELRPFGAG